MRCSEGETQRMSEEYRVWEKEKEYGETFYKRAIGELAEMECSKAVCKILEPIYKKKMKVLDVGCAAGHYLRSLTTRLDKDIDYTGIDITNEYIEMAKKAFPDSVFFVGDINDIPFKHDAFDIVMCNNVLQHLPPFPAKAISELIRVSSKYIVIRIPFAEDNYIIQEFKEYGIDGKPINWFYLNLFRKKTIMEIFNGFKSVKIIDDIFWKELKDPVKKPDETKIIGGKQVSGNIVLDWKFIVVEK